MILTVATLIVAILGFIASVGGLVVLFSIVKTMVTLFVLIIAAALFITLSLLVKKYLPLLKEKEKNEETF